MAFCTDVCCNAEARARRDAEQRAEFERRQAEFEAFLRQRGISDAPEPVAKAGNVELTEAETARLESWLLRHPAAVG